MRILLLGVLALGSAWPLVQKISDVVRALRATLLLNNMDLRANPTSGL